MFAALGYHQVCMHTSYYEEIHCSKVFENSDPKKLIPREWTSTIGA